MQGGALIGDAQPGQDIRGRQQPPCLIGRSLTLEAFDSLAKRIREAGQTFVIEPYVRFKGLPGEQATMFLLDPSGNALEFKAFKDIAKQLFET